ncbi:MAG: [protein-PII] uridylyltransferase [Gammaproteobacteria bacterium]|nr:[protein-PII] uridylyltransferase [Gammaproteobacteria bacterium]
MPNLTPPPVFISKHEWWPSEDEQWINFKLSPLKHKELVRTIQEAVIDAFNEGTAISEIIIGYAITIDYLLWYAWFTHDLHKTNATLLAVGGYGRSELHLHSDIDLMLLLDKNFNDKDKEKLSSFLTFLWDSGLDVGHSVRTVKEAVTEAKKDITIISSILEARPLCGNITLFKELKKATASNKIWNSKKFYYAKKEEMQARHRKYGDTLYQLEPNIKEGPGGMRDIQFIDWVTKRHFGNRALSDLVGKGFLLEEEYNSLKFAQEYLWKMRFSLYLITRRKEERLLFDHQVALAREAGHTNSNSNLAVELYMQNYYRHISECYKLIELLQEHFEETCIPSISWKKQKNIGNHFYSTGDILHAKSKTLFQDRPSAFLELFLTLQTHEHIIKVSSNTIRAIRKNLHLIDNDFRNNIKHKKLFIDILRQPKRIAREVSRMHRLGVLAAYWPAFARIVGRMQYDLYHVYTVDHHILTVLKETRRLGDNKRTEDDISAIYHKLPKLEILYLAALFHDIGKGRDGDHSSEGSQDAIDFCLAHGLSQFDTSIVSWLVENHLVMSITAQHKDLSDPTVVQEFAEKVANATRLDYLYLLTIADIKGTNPTLWNSWRATLLADLYKFTSFQLRAELPRNHDEIIHEIKSSALSLLKDKGHDQQNCENLWSQLNEDYFLRHTDTEIAWHSDIALSAKQDTDTQVHVRQLIRRGSTEIFIYTPDRHNLFANITNSLYRSGLSILDARIITSENGQTFNTFSVVDHNEEPITNNNQLNRIKADINKSLLLTELADNSTSKFVSSRLRHFQMTPTISIQSAKHLDYTSMHIHATDHPGLLAKVAEAFAILGINVISARVSTLGEKVHDIFHITNKDGKKILDVKEQQIVIDMVTKKISKVADETPSSISV